MTRLLSRHLAALLIGEAYSVTVDGAALYRVMSRHLLRVSGGKLQLHDIWSVFSSLTYV